MKTVEELGISPTPWSENKWELPDDCGHDVKDAHRDTICEMFLPQGDSREPNASLIAASPKLYEALRDAVIDACHGCRYEDDGKCTNEDRDCHVQKWRAVLAEASGEGAE